MANIAIYIGRHLCTAPRAIKEADALAGAGHAVTVHGLWFDQRLIARDRALLERSPWRFEPYDDCRPDRATTRARWWLRRAQHRYARRRFLQTGHLSPHVFGYATEQLAGHAARNQADLLVFHSEGGLWAADRLRRSGRRIGIDFEDWFSADLAPEQRIGRPVAELARLEAAAMHVGPYVSTTSQVMATALAKAYAAPEPTVIYNTFPEPVPVACNSIIRDVVSLHWYSQTLGPGRGLEWLFQSLNDVPEGWELNIRADDPSGYARELLALASHRVRDRIAFVATVPNDELPLRIAHHDVGLVLETNLVPNKNLTIANKIFQYMQAGLAVIASDTAGHREVLESARESGVVCSQSVPGSLASALRQFVDDRARLAAAQRAARRAAETVFAHERQVPRYAELAARALAVR